MASLDIANDQVITKDSLEAAINSTKSYVDEKDTATNNIIGNYPSLVDQEVQGQLVPATPPIATRLAALEGRITLVEQSEGGSESGNSAKAFVAVYGVTTAQEILDFIESANEPFAPILVNRGGDYYTVTTAHKQASNKVIIRTFATLNGNYYMYTYTITDNVWANANMGFQQLLVSGTNIKTVNGNSLLGSGNLEIDSGSGGNLRVFEINTTDYDKTFVYAYDGEYSDISKAIYAGEAVQLQINRYGDYNPKERLYPVNMEENYIEEDDLDTDRYSHISFSNKYTRVTNGSGKSVDSFLIYDVGFTLRLTDTGITVLDKPSHQSAKFVVDARHAARIKFNEFNIDGTNMPGVSIYGNAYDWAEGTPYLNIVEKDTIHDTENDTDVTKTIQVEAYHTESEIGFGAEIYTKAYVDTLVEKIAANETAIAALEAKLADFEEFRLQMADGTNTVDKVVLAKPYVAPTPSYNNMFELPEGCYDKDGNFIAPLPWHTSESNDDMSYYGYDTQLDATDLPEGTRGIVFDKSGYFLGWGGEIILNAPDNLLDWIVVDRVPPFSRYTSEWFGTITDNHNAVGTIYTKEGNTPGAPWGLTGAEVDTTGTPLYWERQPQRTMFDLDIGLYDANGNLLFDIHDILNNGYGSIETGETTWNSGINFENIPSEIAQNIKGAVIQSFECRAYITWVPSGQLDWLVYKTDGAYDLDLSDCAPDSIGTIYYNGTDQNAPWAFTGATVNTTGLPIAWEV